MLHVLEAVKANTMNQLKYDSNAERDKFVRSLILYKISLYLPLSESVYSICLGHRIHKLRVPFVH